MISLYNLSLSTFFVLAYFIEKQFQYWPNQRWYIDNIFKYNMYIIFQQRKTPPPPRPPGKNRYQCENKMSIKYNYIKYNS